MRVLQLVLAFGALLVMVVFTGADRTARALPAAGSDRLPVVATIDMTSRLGNETIVLTGWAQVEREAPHDEGGVDVVDMEIVSAELVGASSIGAISVRERPNDGADYVSSGEIRSLQSDQDFPASSFLDLFVDVTVPIFFFPGGESIVVHNEGVFRLTPREAGVDVELNAWPPLGVAYELEPIFGVDNDSDGSIDEDTADEDGDGLYDEDQPGADPPTPGSGNPCGFDPDCDNQEGEDPPLDYCVQNVVDICDDDGDGEMDEDPSCVPLVNPGNINNMKAGFCVRNLTLEFAPELPSYSVARGGPTGLHPADILALTPGDVDPPPPSEPLSLVGCNDDFVGFDRWAQVSFLATAGETYHVQVGSWSSSVGGNLVLDVFSTPGAPTATSVSGNDDFASAWTITALPFLGQQSTSTATTQTGEPLFCAMGGHTVWYSFTASASGTVTASTEATGDVPDTVLAVYIGDGFGSSAGPSGDQAPFVRIPCASLGLTANGCDSSGAVDDLDALSFGADELAGDISELNFSVGPGAQGLAGSAVRAQRDCPSPEPEPDEFHAAFNNTNDQVLDGNGPIGTCPGAFPLGLLEGATVRDDLDALYGQDPAAVDADTNGVPEQPVYFSLDAISPSLATFGFSAADVLKTVNGGVPTVYASAAALGLEAGDDLDALCLGESGNGAYGLDDALAFSLAPGSPTLAQIGAGPGDILLPGNPPTVDHNATSLGLQATDDVNAFKCLALPPPKDPDGDTDGDGILNSEDPDDDNDGCTDEQELDSNPSQGGLRDPHSFWDFFDVPIGEPAVRNQSISIGDVGAVVARFGTFREPPPTKEESFAEALMPPPPAPAYHAAFDRGGSIAGANPWNLRPPDGAITVGDIGAVVAQFGHSCVE